MSWVCSDETNHDHHHHHHDYHHDHHHHDFDDAKRWVCTSGRPEDLATTDRLAKEVLEQQVVQHDHDVGDDHDHDENAFKVREGVPKEIEQQICDNIKWIRLSFPSLAVFSSQFDIESVRFSITSNGSVQCCQFLSFFPFFLIFSFL